MPGPVLGSLVEEKMGHTAETPEQAQRDDAGTDALVIRGEAESWDSARRREGSEGSHQCILINTRRKDVKRMEPGSF